MSTPFLFFFFPPRFGFSIKHDTWPEFLEPPVNKPQYLACYVACKPLVMVKKYLKTCSLFNFSICTIPNQIVLAFAPAVGFVNRLILSHQRGRVDLLLIVVIV
jgi:hypothetical protein